MLYLGLFLLLLGILLFWRSHRWDMRASGPEAMGVLLSYFFSAVIGLMGAIGVVWGLIRLFLG